MMSDKKTVTIRLSPKEIETLNRIKKKYGISNSVQVETLIKNYARKEYGAY
ncbi:Cop-6 protein [Staphylococcus warneri]|nr:MULTISPECIES: Cop-6 protein [Staphylococcus]MCM3484051.1 Cop-6 protein [Staphylococcus warneri]